MVLRISLRCSWRRPLAHKRQLRVWLTTCVRITVNVGGLGLVVAQHP
jgi:hypothetical protein